MLSTFDWLEVLIVPGSFFLNNQSHVRPFQAKNKNWWIQARKWEDIIIIQTLVIAGYKG